MSTAAVSTPAGWYAVGGGLERYWDGAAWTDHFHDPARTLPQASASATDTPEPVSAGTAPVAARAEPLRVFRGNGTGGSTSLTVYPGYVEYEHKNYLVAVPLSRLGPISYSKQHQSPYDSVSINGDIKFGCDNPPEVYDYLVTLLPNP